MSKKKLNAESVMNELRGQSVFFKQSSVVAPLSSEEKITKRINTRTPELPELRTSGLPKLGSSTVPNFQSYGLRNFDELRRLDVRLTWEQKRFLDDWEEEIRQAMPEGERDNPESKRITKNSIMRVLVEIVMQLGVKVDASRFRNESDLLQSLFREICRRVTELQSTEVTE